MHDELNRIRRKPKYKQIDCDGQPFLKQSEVWYRYFRERDDSIITDLFEGQLCGRFFGKLCGLATQLRDVNSFLGAAPGSFYLLLAAEASRISGTRPFDSSYGKPIPDDVR